MSIVEAEYLGAKDASHLSDSIGFFIGISIGNGNCKSILSILGACIRSGDTIELVCDGGDEEAAMEELSALVESGFGEIDKGDVQE